MHGIICSLRNFGYNAIIYLNNGIVSRIPSHILRLWYYRRVMKYEIGAGSHILMGATFVGSRNFVMGTKSTIGQECRLENASRIAIGDNVAIGYGVCFLTASHDLTDPEFSTITEPITVENYAFLGARTIIQKGVTIGEGAVVAAGSVATRDVAPYTVVGGVPAQEICKREVRPSYSTSYGRLFH